jgi:hypothetical protein
MYLAYCAKFKVREAQCISGLKNDRWIMTRSRRNGKRRCTGEEMCGYGLRAWGLGFDTNEPLHSPRPAKHDVFIDNATADVHVTDTTRTSSLRTANCQLVMERKICSGPL